VNGSAEPWSAWPNFEFGSIEKIWPLNASWDSTWIACARARATFALLR
jgi:hypothetical protein